MNLPLALAISLVLALPFMGLHDHSQAGQAEEIEASAQYILGDNDSKLDGRRLALLEAKRNALEKAGTYIESFSEVKNFQLTKDQVRSYAAGILELKEVGEKWGLVGDNQSVTLTVKVKVDKEVVAKQLAAIQKNSETTQALEEARAKMQEYERKIAEMNQALQMAKAPQKEPEKGVAQESPTKKQIQETLEARRKALTGVDVESLLAKASVALTGSADENAVYELGTASSEARSRARVFLNEAYKLAPENPDVLTSLGGLSVEEKDYNEAKRLFRKAISLDPSHAGSHHELGLVLYMERDFSGAEQELRNTIRLKPELAGSHFQLGDVLLTKG